MIVRNCGDTASTAIKSLVPFLCHPEDEVVILDTGSQDDTPEKLASLEVGVRIRVERAPDLLDPRLLDYAKRYKPEMWEEHKDDPSFKDGCIRDFAEARNRSFAFAKNDWCFWIDSDDVLIGAEKFRPIIEEHCLVSPRSAFFLRYDYAHDIRDGACGTALWRERVVPKKHFGWKGTCHETLLPLTGAQESSRQEPLTDIYILHDKNTRTKPRVADLRNYMILKREVDHATPERCDARSLFYLGNAARGLRAYGEAFEYYRIFLPRSGSSEDRIAALLNMGWILMEQGMFQSALTYQHQAVILDPTDPRAYQHIQRSYLRLHRWHESINMGQRVLELAKKRHNFPVFDPQVLGFLPWFAIAAAAVEIQDYKLAVHAAEQAVTIRPNLEPAQDLYRQTIKEEVFQTKANAAKLAMDGLRSTAAIGDVLSRLDIPNGCAKFGVMRLEDYINTDGQKTVAIYCPPTGEDWGPKGPQGLGGSENQVLQIAPRLQKRGLAVTVYTSLPLDQRGWHDGVLWRHHLEFDFRIPRDYVLCWRRLDMMGLPFDTPKRYIWIHDKLDNSNWNFENLFFFDRVLFLSPWHRSIHTAVPDEKVYLTRNGIDVDLIREFDGEERHPYRFVYASCPTRGLKQLLGIWERLWRAGELPEDAELNICYGFGPLWVKAFERGMEYTYDGENMRHRMEYSEEILDTVRQLPSARFLGRVPQKDLYRLLARSGAYLYPTWWPETFCIAAAEAQASGCVPIATTTAALNTTNRWGVRVPENDYTAWTDAFRNYIRFPTPQEKRSEMMINARQAFSIETLADEWKRDLFNGR